MTERTRESDTEDVELQIEEAPPLEPLAGPGWACSFCGRVAADGEVLHVLSGIAVVDCPNCGRPKPHLPEQYDPRRGGRPPGGGPGSRKRR